MPKGRKPGDKAVTSDIKAVIPAAGYGTRLRPVTYAVPKELLPVGRRPMIHEAVAEAVQAGIQEICIVIRKGKEQIREYFKTEGVASIRDSGVKLYFVYQTKPLGLGYALYEARDFISDSSFIMIIPDQFLFFDIPAAKQLLASVESDDSGVWSSIIHLPEEERKYFPNSRSFTLEVIDNKTWRVKGIQEYCDNNLNGNLLGIGRTYFPPKSLTYFSEEYLNPKTGEVDLLFSFRIMIKKFHCYAVLLKGKAMDFGTWPGYEHYSSELFHYTS